MVFGESAHGVVRRGLSRTLDLWVDHADRRFGHCSIFLKVPDVDIFVELQVWHSALILMAITPELLMATLPLSPYTHALLVPFNHDLRRWHWHPALTCVTLVKHAIGLRAHGVFTPSQLYRTLRGMPGVEELLVGSGGNDGSRRAEETSADAG